jgi:hypothetical protein
MNAPDIKYLESLSPKEKQAYEVAKKHLGSLLTIEKTNGYKKWMSTQETKK